jgi:hypothetical protein
MTSVIEYLTPKSAAYYERVCLVVNKISSLIGYKINIYGGAVRDIISHYHDYIKDNTAEFTEPKDIDLHILANGTSMLCATHMWDHFSMNHYNYMMKKLWDNKLIESDKTDYYTIYQDNYSLVKFVIDGIQFDISANINHWCIYDDITDYTVNCLTINNNIIGVRGIQIEVDTIINHIKDKELHNVIDMKKMQKYYDYFDNKESVIAYYDMKFAERRERMLAKNYHE